MFTFSVAVVHLPTDRILTYLFRAETDVLVPVFSQSTDVVVVSFVVVLKFPLTELRFNIIKNLLWLFHLMVLSMCNLQKRLIRAVF